MSINEGGNTSSSNSAGLHRLPCGDDTEQGGTEQNDPQDNLSDITDEDIHTFFEDIHDPSTAHDQGEPSPAPHQESTGETPAMAEDLMDITDKIDLTPLRELQAKSTPQTSDKAKSTPYMDDKEVDGALNSLFGGPDDPDTEILPVVDPGTDEEGNLPEVLPEPLQGTPDEEGLQEAVLMTLSGDYRPMTGRTQPRVPGIPAQDAGTPIQQIEPIQTVHHKTALGMPIEKELSGTGEQGTGEVQRIDTGEESLIISAVESMKKALEESDVDTIDSFIRLYQFLTYDATKGNEIIRNLVKKELEAINGDKIRAKNLRTFLRKGIQGIKEHYISAISKERQIVSITEATQTLKHMDSEVANYEKYLRDLFQMYEIEKILSAPETKPLNIISVSKILPFRPPTSEQRQTITAETTDVPQQTTAQQTQEPHKRKPVISEHGKGKYDIQFANTAPSAVIATEYIQKRREETIFKDLQQKIKNSIGAEFRGQIISRFSPGQIKNTLRNIVEEYKNSQENPDIDILIKAIKSVHPLIAGVEHRKAFEVVLHDMEHKKPAWYRRRISKMIGGVLATAATIGLAWVGIGKRADSNKAEEYNMQTLEFRVNESREETGRVETTDNLKIETAEDQELIAHLLELDPVHIKRPGQDTDKMAKPSSDPEVAKDHTTEKLADPTKPDDDKAGAADTTKPADDKAGATDTTKPDDDKAGAADTTKPDDDKAGAADTTKPDDPKPTDTKPTTADNEPDDSKEKGKRIRVKRGQTFFHIVGDKDHIGLYDEWDIDTLKKLDSRLKKFDRWDMLIIIAHSNGKKSLFTKRNERLKVPTWEEMIKIYLSQGYMNIHREYMEDYRNQRPKGDEFAFADPLEGELLLTEQATQQAQLDDLLLTANQATQHTATPSIDPSSTQNSQSKTVEDDWTNMLADMEAQETVEDDWANMLADMEVQEKVEDDWTNMLADMEAQEKVEDDWTNMLADMEAQEKVEDDWTNMLADMEAKDPEDDSVLHS